MIRDSRGILGEVNDPNTVLASGTLTSDHYVVGAGNKGVKIFSPGANRLIVTNTAGVASGFAFGTANKVIGTNASGQLTLLDPVVQKYNWVMPSGTANWTRLSGNVPIFSSSGDMIIIRLPSGGRTVVRCTSPIVLSNAARITFRIGYAAQASGGGTDGSMSVFNSSISQIASQSFNSYNISASSLAFGSSASYTTTLSAGTYYIGVACGWGLSTAYEGVITSLTVMEN
jgi:hypothetical protein